MQGPKAGASVAQAEHNPTAAIMEQPMLDPHSNGIGPDFDFCRKYVWTNLLYVSNLYPHQFGINPQVFMEVEYPDQHGHMVKHKVPDYMDHPNLGCMGHSWYLSNDFQMHMLTPWLLLLFRKNNAAGYLLMSAIIAGSLGYIGFLVGEWHYGLCSQQLQDPPGGHVTPAAPRGEGYNQATLFYGKPWCRVGPFMLGVMLACYQSVNSNKAVRANRSDRCPLVALTVSACCAGPPAPSWRAPHHDRLPHLRLHHACLRLLPVVGHPRGLVVARVRLVRRLGRLLLDHGEDRVGRRDLLHDLRSPDLPRRADHAVPHLVLLDPLRTADV